MMEDEKEQEKPLLTESAPNSHGLTFENPMERISGDVNAAPLEEWPGYCREE